LTGDLLSRVLAVQEEAPASSDKLDKIRELVEEGARIEETIESLEEALKAQKGRFNRIKQYELVNLMKEANMGVYNSLDGKVKTKLEMFVGGSLPKDEFDKEVALGEIIRVGGQSLIKTNISIEFPKTAHNMANDMYSRILEIVKKYNVDFDLEPVMKEGIHPKSLQSFVKEAIKKGSDIDVEKLKMTHGQNVKFEFFVEDDKGKLKRKKARAKDRSRDDGSDAPDDGDDD
jgi:hypothetical protein